MEKATKAKQYKKKHAWRHLHRPLDAYQLYEREHMPHDIGFITDHPIPKPRTHQTLRPDYYDTGREVQPPYIWPDVRVSRPDYYETGTAMQPCWYPPEGDNGAGDFEESVDAEAEEFIRAKHYKFELSKWASMNPKY